MNTTQLIEKVAAKVAANKYIEKLFFTQGNFSLCVLRNSSTYVIYSIGVSKRNPNCDEPNSLYGKQIAYIRAVRQLVDRKTQHI